jgi:hypothetical protein
MKANGAGSILWPANKIERRLCANLVPYARNARTHSTEQVAQLAASIREWGWTVPVLVDPDDNIIAGHGRVLAADKLGIVEIPVMVARGWSDAKIRAYRIADNKLAENSSWNDELLTLEFADLRDAFDLSMTGFTVEQLDSMFAADTDAASEWQGMPEFEQNSKLAFKTLVVHFKDADAVVAFSKAIGQLVTEATKFIWYPQQEKRVLIDKAYVSDEQPTS